jgi:hypothetical protein
MEYSSEEIRRKFSGTVFRLKNGLICAYLDVCGGKKEALLLVRGPNNEEKRFRVPTQTKETDETWYGEEPTDFDYHYFPSGYYKIDEYNYLSLVRRMRRKYCVGVNNETHHSDTWSRKNMPIVDRALTDILSREQEYDPVKAVRDNFGALSRDFLLKDNTIYYRDVHVGGIKGSALFMDNPSLVPYMRNLLGEGF